GAVGVSPARVVITLPRLGRGGGGSCGAPPFLFPLLPAAASRASPPRRSLGLWMRRRQPATLTRPDANFRARQLRLQRAAPCPGTVRRVPRSEHNGVPWQAV